MSLAARVQGILFRPDTEWAKIKSEPASPKSVICSYVLILAAIPALAQFLGLVIVGHKLPFVGWARAGVGFALGRAVWTYLINLAMVYVGAVIVNTIAPTFLSRKDFPSAFKLVAYAVTPQWIAGAFYLVPFLGILAVAGALYGIYLLYAGIQAPMIGTPKDRSIVFALVLAAIWIVLEIITGLVGTAIFAVGGIYRPF